jgi:hypothetical protein
MGMRCGYSCARGWSSRRQRRGCYNSVQAFAYRYLRNLHNDSSLLTRLIPSQRPNHLLRGHALVTQCPAPSPSSVPFCIPQISIAPPPSLRTSDDHPVSSTTRSRPSSSRSRIRPGTIGISRVVRLSPIHHVRRYRRLATPI